MALDAEDQKRMYENLEWLVGYLDHEETSPYAQAHLDGLIDTLTALTGLEDDGHGMAVLDPSTRDDANRVLIRWLRAQGRLPKRRR